jgi:signal transduction histidine kinase
VTLPSSHLANCPTPPCADLVSGSTATRGRGNYQNEVRVGDRAADAARPSGGGAARPADDQLGDVARVAESVRDAVRARATLVSRVVDDQTLEVVVVAGTPSQDGVVGHRWAEADLEALISGAEQRGRLHLTQRPAAGHLEVPDDNRRLPGSLGLLVVPLRTARGDLVGALVAEGPAEIIGQSPATLERVELYADQARLALEALHEQEVVDELRRLDQYRRDLVASLTHDLRTPLTAIALNTELLESDRHLEAGAHPVAAIRRSAERLSSLVDDLMTLARAEEGGLTGRDEIGDVAAVLRDACRYAEVEAQQRGITTALDMPDTLPARVDVEALARIYVNVVGNAVKFSLPDGEVRLGLRRDGDTVELVCADDGIGIAEEDRAAVFDMYRRSRDPKARDVPGTGLGLAISHRIVTWLGGTITFESAPGQGSTFTVRVPG